MPCKSFCICGQELTRFNGYLLNLSDKVLSDLEDSPKFQKIKSNHTVDDKVKHFCLCPKCLVKCLGRPINITDFKYKSNRWMTSNVAYILRTKSKLSEALPKLQSLDDCGVLPFAKSEFKIMMRCLH